MARGSGSKITSIKDRSGLVDQLVHELSTKGSARLVHLGLFRVVPIKGRKRYDFKERRVVSMKPYKQLTFQPAKGIRDILQLKDAAVDE